MDSLFNHLKVATLSYKTAPLEIREQFSLNESKTKQFLQILRERFDLSEVLVVSTCNRTELYYNFPGSIGRELVHCLCEFSSTTTTAESYFRYIDDSLEATQYLFEVAVGLHSQVLGDLQITHQFKKSYQWSADLHMAGALLHRLMHTVFFANKRIVQETDFRNGAASISYAATELIDDLTQSDEQVKILLIGTGEIGEDTAHNLLSAGYEQFCITNRTLEKAQKLAERLSTEGTVRVLPFERLSEFIADFDVIISAIESSVPVVREEHFESNNVLTHKYFIDLSVPRTISPDIEKIPGCIVYDVEELSVKTTEAQQRRLSALPKVQEILAEALVDFADWSKEMEISPTINKIKHALETIRVEELNRYQKQLTEDQLKMVETITKNILQKYLKLPVIQLKAACKRGESGELSEILNELFDIEKLKELKK